MKLFEHLKTMFGDDAILIVGNWSAPTVKSQEPTRNKGLLRYLHKSGFSIYMLNEYKTSTWCPSCITGELETFKEVLNPRPFRRKENPAVVRRKEKYTVICHGLLR